MVQLSNFEIINPKNKQIIQLHSYVYWYKQIDNDNLKKKKKMLNLYPSNWAVYLRNVLN